MPFGNVTTAPPLSAEQFKTLKPGEKIVTDLDVADEPNYHFISTIHQPRLVTEAMALPGFSAGKFEFKAYVGPDVVFSEADDGTYQHRNIPVNILNGLVKADDFSIDISKVWDSELLTFAEVTFN